LKEQLIIVGIIAILLAVGLSGCNETQQQINYWEHIEIVPHYTGANYTAEEYYLTYQDYVMAINGTIRNLAGEMLKKVEIRVKFYDSDETNIGGGTTVEYEVHNLEERDFTYYAYRNHMSHWDEVDWDNVQFEFRTPWD
jgi:hypothetical protein